MMTVNPLLVLLHGLVRIRDAHELDADALRDEAARAVEQALGLVKP